MINLTTNSISLDLFHTVLKEIKNRPDYALDLMDSFSKNQFKSKGRILGLIDDLRLDHAAEVVILGCWYGSILIPVLHTKFKRVTGIDIDAKAISASRHNLFKSYENLELIAGDVFSLDLARYRDTTLLINTSCEHMMPMKSWPFWKNLHRDAYFALQSNNMFGIDGHTNCVNSLDEFKLQLPENCIILAEDELIDDRGTRYTIVGKITN